MIVVFVGLLVISEKDTIKKFIPNSKTEFKPIYVTIEIIPHLGSLGL